MVWIKRNLIFVIVAIIGVGLTAYCGYLLYSAMAKNQGIIDDYNQNLNSLNQLRQQKPYADDAAIKAAKEDEQRVQAFVADFHKVFAPFPTPPTEDPRGFNDYLQRTVYQWGIDATNSGVLLPPNFTFSWGNQLSQLSHEQECLGPWMEELQQQKLILEVLFRAHVNYLYRIQRASITACDDQGGEDYVQTSVTSNSWEEIWPYAVSFRGFSSDLAAVLSGFAHASNCFIVKTVNVEPSKDQLPEVIAPPNQAATPQAQVFYRPPVYQPVPGFGREGRGAFRSPRPYGMAPQQMAPQVMATPATPSAPVTILTENPLYITIHVDVVKIK